MDPRSTAAALSRSEQGSVASATSSLLAASRPAPGTTSAPRPSGQVSRGSGAMGSEWRQVGQGAGGSQAAGAAAEAVDPWYEGEAVPAAAVSASDPSDDALDDWEQTAALISDEAAGERVTAGPPCSPPQLRKPAPPEGHFDPDPPHPRPVAVLSAQAPPQGMSSAPQLHRCSRATCSTCWTATTKLQSAPGSSPRAFGAAPLSSALPARPSTSSHLFCVVEPLAGAP